MAESHAEREARIQAFWNKDNTFQKSIDKPSPQGDFTFYDGPPFATGTPHYGHILAGTIKDVIPRYQTMNGYSVRRRWGWDCHGLPVENLIEKELGLKSKKDILDYGIGKFNAASRGSVMRYADEWRRIVPRLGRWVDMENDYRTMDSSYTESVWWAFKKLHDKGLIYDDFKIMYYCTRCETTLSNFEVAQGYRDITDISVYVPFEITGEPNTFLLAWTTTPWTLPGNVALAVGANIEYSKVKTEKGTFLVATARLGHVFKDKAHEIVGTVKGSELVGKSFKPLFNYYAADTSLKNRENGWKVYAGDFVTTTDGTGIVHIAPAFGADDYALLKVHKLPFVQHVAADGTFKPEVTDFAGMKVKPKDTDEDKNAHQKTDVEVIRWLAHNGSLFEKEKLIHSYPHCWRCDTPLLNFAASSWFVKVTDFKDKLVKENKKISWVPESVGQGRFGNWLEGARDWAISRTRFWGAPIPVWREEKTGATHVLGSVADLKKFSRAKNTFYVMRHGEAENNILGILSGKANVPHHLTEKGRKQVAEAVDEVRKINPDLIFVSPFIRTQETMQILKEKLGWKDSQIRIDDRIHELHSGDWDGKNVREYVRHFNNLDRFNSHPDGVENFADIKKRMGDFLYDTESHYSGKTILVITHECPAHLLIAAALGLNRKDTVAVRKDEKKEFLNNAEVRKLDFVPLPHNEEYELDLHRPFIDEIPLVTEAGNKLTRVQDVFDCWFESGSMPYAEAHYPFVNGKGTEEGRVFDPKSGIFRSSRGFPADFIAEGVDQTRGWFYSMLVLGTALFGKTPYKRVVVNGLILAEDGTKMSKSKANFPDPMLIVEKYGADALRYYLMSSQAVRAEDLRFSEKGVDEVVKKIVNRLLNVVSFYEMYAGELKAGSAGAGRSANILDEWILSRLNETVATVTSGMESYELDRATRPVEGFIDDLSTWYLRRSRERFKGDDAADKQAALATTRTVLIELSKVLAPFMPFVAEDIYLRTVDTMKAAGSVHLESWPKAGKVNERLLADMKAVRGAVTLGLEARMKAKINVRQPLATLKIKDAQVSGLSAHLLELVKDEVNVKTITADTSIQSDVELDTILTPALKEEGDLRELLRKIQDARKEKGLNVGDKAVLVATNDLKDLISKNEKEIKAATNLSAVEFGDTFGLK